MKVIKNFSKTFSEDVTLITLYVDGLNEEGPGDIVGSFVNEADIDPKRIGEIDISETGATVEVDESVAGRIVARVDGGTIGQSNVSVYRMNDDMKAVHSYVDRNTRLVEHEREEEMRRHENEIKNLSGKERQQEGRAILNLRGRDQGEGLSGHHVKFLKESKGEPLPDTEIRVGDLVMLSRDDPLRDDNPTGTVVEITNYSVTVSMDGRPPGFLLGRGIRMDLYVNDITYQRMKEALNELPGAEGALKELRDLVVGLDEPDPVEAREENTWFNEQLNESQKNAVARAINSERAYLIHGPPGTGKTTTAVEIIQQCVEEGDFVLATAASNTAVDNILEFLLDKDVDALRVGHPARVIPSLKQQTLDVRIEDYEDYQRSLDLRERAFDRLDEQEDLTAPSGQWRRGMADDQIKSLAKNNQGSRGVPPEKIQEMADWLNLQEEADELFELSDRLEQQAIEDLLRDVDVVCTTNSTAGSNLLDGKTFDTLVIDEATQATEPSCLIPITRAKRVIMAGDHRQLPPTVVSKDASDGGLGKTLFERLANRHYDELASLLQRQYRMHEDIMKFCGEVFYEDKLKSDESVESHTLTDFGIEADNFEDKFRDVLRPDNPMVFVDTVRMNAKEKQRHGSTSRENPYEAKLVNRFVDEYLEAGIPPRSIAVISPYDDQVERISKKRDEDALEVDTVDGFQGREKEIVIISLVRSNDSGEIGFLNESRRFNVAISRAKRKSITVGDSSTICRSDIFSQYVDYARDTAHVEVIEP